SGLQADLRDYQEEGVHWLLRLERWASGACLADEMGLGKTVQALALLLHRGKAGPSIVVLPTSLSDGWASEATRFAPALRTIVYRGPERAALLEGLGPNDLLLCSYEVLVRDLETLSAIEWSTTVFDEAHALKTYRTRRARAARELRSGFRLALTGTPLENHLGELWSLFGILLPGLLGPWPRFRRRFALPIEEDGNAARRAGLVRVLSPFLLRRTKAQVARELPPRTDVIQPVELSADEMALYEAERRRAVRELGSAGEEESGRFAMLAALMRLRRLACHPALVHPGSTIPSSKLEAFLELVTDLHSEGHRALVFSQFTSHLGIVRDALNRRGVQLLYLDGSTPAAHRSELVRQWQEGDLPIFLISLKAGGTGLNLTAADTVIHLDPWWNPATEDQASDRAHRIGQTLPVTIIRLIARGTIEEKVLALHDEKRDLARGILEGSESNAKLEIKDLMALLRTGPNL
ncbi:MAG: DEAD/DEAH box helicase, partial [Myxococcales bacterium]|nr:DEAD/DEAH box helicase [Myxococcales bacterium]